MKVLIEQCSWSNIGDGFYQLSLMRLIKKLFPHWQVYQQEGPVKREFRPGKRFASNVLNLMDAQRARLHIFSGPVIARQLLTSYRKSIEDITRRGDHYALLSCSGSMTNEHEFREMKDFFFANPPIAFWTRDGLTHDWYKDVIPYAYNGICAAFLVNQLPVADVDMGEPYFVSCFYTQREPVYRMPADSVDPHVLQIQPRKIPMGLPKNIWRHVEWMQSHPSYAGKLRIVRTRHGTTFKFPHLNFPAPNSFVSHNPLHYLALYKSAQFTVSDRVHACVASLALGRPAKLIFHDPRCSLFDRIGLDGRARQGFMTLDPAVIDQENRGIEDYLKDRLGGLS